jgi:hypothetical protein
MNVNSQPAGGNIQYTRIEDGILFFTGASTPGTYKFTLTVTNSSGTYTTPEITFTNSGSAPGLGTFIVASDPEQMEYYSYVGSGGEGSVRYGWQYNSDHFPLYTECGR